MRQRNDEKTKSALNVGIASTIVAALLVAVVFVNYKNADQGLKIGDARLSFETAESEEERRQGLSDRESLAQDSAMLFVFGSPNQYGIWMKDMNFNLDIIWLDANKKVVHIEEDVSPDTYPEVFTPSSPAKYVVEVNSGVVAGNNIVVGTVAEF